MAKRGRSKKERVRELSKLMIERFNDGGSWEMRNYDEISSEDAIIFFMQFELARAFQGVIIEQGESVGDYGPGDFLDAAKTVLTEGAAEDYGGPELLPDVLNGYEEAWYKVKVPEGCDMFSEAVRKARADGREPAFEHYSPNVVFIANVARVLQEASGDAPIQLPLKRIAGAIGRSVGVAQTIMRTLERNAVIICVDPTYSYAEKRAKEYRYVPKEKRGPITMSNQDNQDKQDYSGKTRDAGSELTSAGSTLETSTLEDAIIDIASQEWRARLGANGR